jgi:hypothetical protein
MSNGWQGFAFIRLEFKYKRLILKLFKEYKAIKKKNVYINFKESYTIWGKHMIRI